MYTSSEQLLLLLLTMTVTCKHTTRPISLGYHLVFFRPNIGNRLGSKYLPWLAKKKKKKNNGVTQPDEHDGPPPTGGRCNLQVSV